MHKIYVAKSSHLGDDQKKIDFMNKLIDVVHKTAECGLSPGEVKDMLYF